MMRFTTALVMAAALLSAAPSFAQTDPAAPAEPTPAAEAAAPTENAPVGALAENAPVGALAEAEGDDNPDRVICRTVEVTGSRLRTRRERICGTRSQWETMQDDAARGVRNRGSVQGARD